jgi:hypothetical protein
MTCTVVCMDNVDVGLRAGAIRDFIRKTEHRTVKAWCAANAFNRDTLNKLMSGDRRCTWSTLLRLAALLEVEPESIADIAPRQMRRAA